MSKDMNIPTLMKRYTLPPGCSCHSFVMRELTGKDEIEAAIWADKNRGSAETGFAAMIGAEQREAMRLALVEVDGRPVNVDGIPFGGFDKFTYRTMRFVTQAFNDLNAVQASEIEVFSQGAEIVGPTATSSTEQAPA